ncbi:hypothetical protein B1R32_10315 [Abditibacterium utsteinense]|uniref:Uncharacterized protein n=1 Tax=Abditibacterium utsteinense TaxID=1960156 RepID=A0A2S8SVC6_9BACT|nr:hypothetical protein B1R32_10315 [Abditibacterium utsteinense]
MIFAIFALTTLFSFPLGVSSRIDLEPRACTGATSLGFGCYLLWNCALMRTH